MSDDPLPKTPNWDIPIDPHFGEIGKNKIPDDMDDHDIDKEEEEIIPDDVIDALGFDPKEEEDEDKEVEK